MLRFTLVGALAPTLRYVAPTHLHSAEFWAEEILAGVSIALSGAAALWVGSLAARGMDAGLSDTAGMSADPGDRPELQSTISIVTVLIVTLGFLEWGGLERISWALSEPLSPRPDRLVRSLGHLASGLHLALVVAIPALATRALVNATGHFAARLLSPQPPLNGVLWVIRVTCPSVVLALIAILFVNSLEALVEYGRGMP